MIEGKAKKHVLVEDGQECCIFDDGEKSVVPKVELRKGLVVKVHEDLQHRGADATHYELRRNYYWPGIK